MSQYRFLEDLNEDDDPPTVFITFKDVLSTESTAPCWPAKSVVSDGGDRVINSVPSRGKILLVP